MDIYDINIYDISHLNLCSDRSSVPTRFFSSRDLETLSSLERLLAAYLLGSPSGEYRYQDVSPIPFKSQDSHGYIPMIVAPLMDYFPSCKHPFAAGMAHIFYDVPIKMSIFIL